ncbi:hypothetical protein BXZ70DRAFT_483169 [Cristinia sonorae]|uniref:Zn(2)-C6 fungal-type domain-containing protein n=1 Tax=Cristinia sonorae TaxID=1940300 RepID=A0A8K0XM52_9AGAR|nr:hypothetical protein BXZ70DRAFT_483169 [Cristinia sonorae]
MKGEDSMEVSIPERKERRCLREQMVRTGASCHSSESRISSSNEIKAPDTAIVHPTLRSLSDMTIYNILYDDAGNHHFVPAQQYVDFDTSSPSRMGMDQAYNPMDFRLSTSAPVNNFHPSQPQASHFSDFLHQHHQEAQFRDPWGHSYHGLDSHDVSFSPHHMELTQLHEPTPIRPVSPRIAPTTLETTFLAAYPRPEATSIQYPIEELGGPSFGSASSAVVPRASSSSASTSDTWDVAQQPSTGASNGISGSLDPVAGVFQQTSENTRVRTKQACNECRDSKSKCTGQSPCGRCKRRNLSCEYAEVLNTRGPNRPKDGTNPTPARKKASSRSASRESGDSSGPPSSSSSRRTSAVPSLRRSRKPSLSIRPRPQAGASKITHGNNVINTSDPFDITQPSDFPHIPETFNILDTDEFNNALSAAEAFDTPTALNSTHTFHTFEPSPAFEPSHTDDPPHTFDSPSTSSVSPIIPEPATPIASQNSDRLRRLCPGRLDFTLPTFNTPSPPHPHPNPDTIVDPYTASLRRGSLPVHLSHRTAVGEPTPRAYSTEPYPFGAAANSSTNSTNTITSSSSSLLNAQDRLAATRNLRLSISTPITPITVTTHNPFPFAGHGHRQDASDIPSVGAQLAAWQRSFAVGLQGQGGSGGGWMDMDMDQTPTQMHGVRGWGAERVVG